MGERSRGAVEMGERRQIKRERVVEPKREQGEQAPLVPGEPFEIDVLQVVEDGWLVGRVVWRHGAHAQHPVAAAAVIQVSNGVEEVVEALEEDRSRHVEQIPELLAARPEVWRHEVAGVERDERYRVADQVALPRHREVEQRIPDEGMVVPVVVEAHQPAPLESLNRGAEAGVGRDNAVTLRRGEHQHALAVVAWSPQQAGHQEGRSATSRLSMYRRSNRYSRRQTAPCSRHSRGSSPSRTQVKGALRIARFGITFWRKLFCSLATSISMASIPRLSWSICSTRSPAASTTRGSPNME